MMKNQQSLTLAEGGAGLVLSGGGAKGAYQVGVVKCLAKHGVRLSAIAGTSVGALNGAVIATSPDLDSATDRLEEIWRKRLSTMSGPLTVFQELAGLYEEYMAPYEASLEARLSLYVGVFRSRGKLVDLAWAAAGLVGLSDTPEADFIQVQTLPRREYKQALLASAAYPLICAAPLCRRQTIPRWRPRWHEQQAGPYPHHPARTRCWLPSGDCHPQRGWESVGPA